MYIYTHSHTHTHAHTRQQGRYIYTRDYLTVKVWDTYMPSVPVSVIHVNPSLRPHLADLYETDAIFDKFECAVSGDGKHVATGMCVCVRVCFLVVDVCV